MELYPFQKEDVEKLIKVKSALIGSEVGTGKTLEAIAIEDDWYQPAEKKPVLIVCPTNVRDSWQEKYGLQSPSTDTLIMGRKPEDRVRFVDQLRRNPKLVGIMHWDALRLMPELRQIEFQTIVGDEIHRISNRKSQVSHSLKLLKTVHKLGLSGTASGDKPVGLWSPLNWLYPKEYGSFWRYFNTFIESETVYPQGFRKEIGPKNLDQLHFELSHFYVRHLKKQQCCKHHPQGVMPWLPDETYSTLWVDLSPKQRKLYDGMRKDMIAWVGAHEDSPLVASAVVAQMTRLSQFALASATLTLDDRVVLEEPSSKLDALCEWLEDNPTKQVVVFSASKQILYLAKNRLKDKAAVYSGDQSDKQRTIAKSAFERGDIQVFLAVIEAAAEGMDGLQRVCDTMIFLDRSWKTIKNQQAIGRLSRDGQEGQKVHVIDIMAKNTLDLGRFQRLEQKWSWIQALLNGRISQTTGEVV